MSGPKIRHLDGFTTMFQNHRFIKTLCGGQPIDGGRCVGLRDDVRRLKCGTTRGMVQMAVAVDQVRDGFVCNLSLSHVAASALIGSTTTTPSSVTTTIEK